MEFWRESVMPAGKAIAPFVAIVLAFALSFTKFNERLERKERRRNRKY